MTREIGQDSESYFESIKSPKILKEMNVIQLSNSSVRRKFLGDGEATHLKSPGKGNVKKFAKHIVRNSKIPAYWNKGK